MVLHNLAAGLTARHEVFHVLAPRAKRKNRTVDDYVYPVHRYGEPSSKRFLVRQTLVYLSWLHLRHRFDLLHCHAAYPQAYVGATFKKIFKCPMVVRPHGSDIVPGGRMRKNPRLEERVRLALHEADAIIAQGHYLQDIILQLGISPWKIIVINNGVDLNAFAKGNIFPHPKPYILALGNLIQRKNFDMLLKAFKALREHEIDLLIAGAGREKQHLQKISGELGLGQQVHFLGNVTGKKKIDLFKSALFFVCPSRKEPFANVILEALAAGLPVIASAVDGNLELVHHESHGLLFPVDDEEGLTFALHRMISEPGLAEKLRHAVPSFIKNFDWPIIAERYLQMYKKIAGKNFMSTR